MKVTGRTFNIFFRVKGKIVMMQIFTSEEDICPIMNTRNGSMNT